VKKNPTQLSTDVGDRLCDVLAAEGEMVSKWFAVAEVIAADGRRWLRVFCPDDSAPWDNLGLLTAARDQVKTYWGGGADDDD
jgi:hypothetical protein